MLSHGQESKPGMPDNRKHSGILARFSHLVSAQLVEGVLSALFFFYLAWLNSTLYGQVMYAFAAGGMVMKVVQYGLYYYLVGDLVEKKCDDTAKILNRANIIKLLLMVPSMLLVWGFSVYSGFDPQMSWILFFVCLGFALESLAETYFSDLRVRGEQKKEGWIKATSHVLAYGSGFLTAFLGMAPVIVGLFKFVSGLVRIVLSLIVYLRYHTGNPFALPSATSVWSVFRLSTVFALIDILQTFYTRANVFFIEKWVGVKGVGYYSATYMIVDGVSWLAAEQLVGAVLFPMLAVLWSKKSHEFNILVKSTMQWLLIVAGALMFVFSVEADLIIGFIYPKEFGDAVWMQRFLVWTILLSFIQYLCAYVMMVVGAARILLVFSVIGMALNLLLNATLVKSFGLMGGCLVIVLTRFVMAFLTLAYCQIRFKFFGISDFGFPAVLAAACLGFFFVVAHFFGVHVGVVGAGILFGLILYKWGKRFIKSPHLEAVAERDSS